MAQLHELLAVERDIKSTTEKIITETKALFANKKDHFQGAKKTYRAYSAEDTDRPEGGYKPVVTSVDEKLKYVFPYIVRQMDHIFQKEKTDTIAKADIIVENDAGESTKLASDVPVIALVQYETLLTQIRDVVDNIPTLDPAFEWNKDATDGLYKTKEIVRQRTKKVNKPIVMYQATDKHPAQTQLVTEDVPVGDWIELATSGAYSPIEKSRIMARVDMLLEAVKRARARANKTETVNDKIGQSLVNFLKG